MHRMTALISSQLHVWDCHFDGLKSATVRVPAPEKSVNALSQGFVSPERQWLIL